MMTVAECITKLEGLVPRIAEQGAVIMREEVPVRTGALKASISATPQGTESYFVGTSIEYAKYVEHGRGPVVPKKARVLHWFDGKDIFAKSVVGVPKNDFVGRTISRLRSYISLHGIGG